jgi:hypothetical protein
LNFNQSIAFGLCLCVVACWIRKRVRFEFDHSTYLMGGIYIFGRHWLVGPGSLEDGLDPNHVRRRPPSSSSSILRDGIPIGYDLPVPTPTIVKTPHHPYPSPTTGLKFPYTHHPSGSGYLAGNPYPLHYNCS